MLSNKFAKLSLALCVVFSLSAISFADEEMTTSKETITLPLADKPESNLDRPIRGESQKTVLNAFGEPLTRHPTRGKPPISKWDYPDFTVIFESGYVIHTVIKTNL